MDKESILLVMINQIINYIKTTPYKKKYDRKKRNTEELSSNFVRKSPFFTDSIVFFIKLKKIYTY